MVRRQTIDWYKHPFRFKGNTCPATYSPADERRVKAF